ncbi:MAG: PTS sugar transporter subunit IIC [Candidatus Palauibacterales bacterium]|nr:PTS sugar transporter subunit IIC [Candidatus Palauibacterales bacterium]
MTELGLTSGQWLLLCLAGAVTGADDTSWPLAMVSRPLVAATAAGAVVGDAGAGLLAGAILELMTLPYPRMGATSTPDPGPAGVVGGAAFAMTGGGAPALAAAVLGGWGAGWTGHAGVRALRALNGWMTEPRGELAGDPSRLESRHRWCLRLDFLRGAVVTGALVVPAGVLASLLGAAPPAGGWAVLAAGVAAAGVGSAAGSAGRVLSTGRWRAAWLVGGLLAGVGAAALAGV